MTKANTGKPMKKMEAVRRAMNDLGDDAKPIQLQGHIKAKFGIEMGADHVSVCKGKILKATPTAKRASLKASANGSQVAPLNGPPTRAAAPKPAAASLSSQVAMLKAVAGAIGKEEAKRIIDLL